MIKIDSKRLFAEPPSWMSDEQHINFRKETIRLLDLVISGDAVIGNETCEITPSLRKREEDEYWAWRISQGQQNPHFSPYRNYN